jgi:hypothetical protein
MPRKLMQGAWVGLALAVAGCGRGPALAPVSGTVTMNGKPLARVRVEFWPEEGSPRSTGSTDEAGRFTLTTDGTAKPGAVVGRHKVVLYDLLVYQAVGIRPREDTNIREIPARFPFRYNDAHQTPLSATVGPQPNEIELAVDVR